MRTGMEAAVERSPTPSARRARPIGSRGALAAILGLLIALSATFALPSCGSTGASSEAGATAGKPVEMRYRAIAKNLTFGLVNESHTDRTELYSSTQPLDRATTKVSPDEVIDATVEYFREQGFFAIATRGPAPANPPQGATQVLEVTLPDGAWHAVMRPGVAKEFIASFQACAKGFLELYSNTMQFQAVDEAPDWSGSSAKPAPSKSRPGG